MKGATLNLFWIGGLNVYPTHVRELKGVNIFQFGLVTPLHDAYAYGCVPHKHHFPKRESFRASYFKLSKSSTFFNLCSMVLGFLPGPSRIHGFHTALSIKSIQQP